LLDEETAAKTPNRGFLRIKEAVMNNHNPGQGLGIAALVVSLLAFASGGLAGVALAMIAVVLGVVSKKQSDDARMPSSMATAGIICGLLALGFSAVCVVLTCVEHGFRFCAGGIASCMDGG
jgi:hypothetical protein